MLRQLAARCAFTLALLVPALAMAAWPHDPYSAMPLTTTAPMQIDAAVVADGAGGAIVVWADGREEFPAMYAQRVSADGDLLWDPAGVMMSFRGPYDAETSSGGSRAVIVPDGAGGAIVAWGADSSWWHPTLTTRVQIVAQRVTAAGAVLWGAGGVFLCNAPGSRSNFAITADGAGGAIVAWDDQRDYTLPFYDPDAYESDIFAQRVSADGVVQWAVDGEAVFDGAGVQLNPAVAGDGAGGAFVSWRTYDDVAGSYLLRAQRIAAGGGRQWGDAGLEISARGSSPYTAMAEDGAGGAIVTWREAGEDGDRLLVQRLDAAGNGLWTAGGVRLEASCWAHFGPVITPDGAGGAVIAWQDDRGLDVDIHAQRVSAGGEPLWTPGGVRVSDQLGDELTPILVSDGAGGAVVAWSTEHYRYFIAQRVTAAGDLLWSSGGAIIAAGPYAARAGIVGNGAGGAVLAWANGRAVAHGIDAAGATYRSEPVIEGVRDIAADEGGKVRLRWAASNLDRRPTSGAMYEVWRRIDAKGDDAASWESLGSVPARAYDSYTFTAPTLADSCAVGAAPSTYMVEYYDHSQSWEAAPASGWSVDNLAPAPPANVRLAPGRRLAWDAAREPDFRQFTVYGSGVGWLDDSAVALARTTGTGLEVGDLAYPFLLVTATDIHDNESAAGGTSAPISLRVHDAAPNPFNPQVTITFDLPRAGRARLDVHDAAGRLVRRLVEDDLAAGRHVATWDGRTADGREAASGMYLVRLGTESGSTGRKITLLR